MTVLSTGQVAKIFKCSSRTVIKWCDDQGLKHYTLPGTAAHRRIIKEDLIDFCNRQGLPVPKELTEFRNYQHETV